MGLGYPCCGSLLEGVHTAKCTSPLVAEIMQALRSQIARSVASFPRPVVTPHDVFGLIYEEFNIEFGEEMHRDDVAAGKAELLQVACAAIRGVVQIGREEPWGVDCEPLLRVTLSVVRRALCSNTQSPVRNLHEAFGVIYCAIMDLLNAMRGHNPIVRGQVNTELMLVAVAALRCIHDIPSPADGTE